MRILLSIILVLIICGLLIGAFINNLWRFMPEFYYLDTIITVPLFVQLVFVLSAMLLGLLIILKKIKHLAFIFAFIIFSLFSIASWYQFNLSNRLNSFIVSLSPFYHKEISFNIIKKVKIDKKKIHFLTTSGSLSVHTGLFPLGLNDETIWKKLIDFGNCVQKNGDQCREIDFAWP